MVKGEFVDSPILADNFEALATAGDNLLKDTGLATKG